MYRAKVRILGAALFLSFVYSGVAVAAEAGEVIAKTKAIESLLAVYRAEGASDLSAERAKAAWESKVEASKVEVKGQLRSCADCHGVDLTQEGVHKRTKKSIKAMALSVEPERYQDVKKIEKWFKRNCKWAWGRECSVQEKSDFLVFLSR
jgi:cytochrome c553